MAARNFSEDGAAGAMTGTMTSGTPGQQTGGVSTTLRPSTGVNNFNMTGTPADSSSAGTIGIGEAAIGQGGWGGGGFSGDGFSGGSDSGQGMSTTIGGSDAWGGAAPGGVRAEKGPSYWGGDWRDQSRQAGQNTGSPVGLSGFSFAQGGAIDDGEGDPNATDPQGSMMGSSLQRSINQALSTVNNALSYGRKLHGIGGGGGGSQGEAIQTAGAMPTIPGTQSESGAPRERPAPGALPPLANPFGKRASNDGAGDDQSQAAAPQETAAIDTEEEAA